MFMKRYSNLYQKIIDKENLRTAFMKASIGKRQRKSVKKILDNLDYYIDDLYNQLANGTYHTSSYHTKVIYEPKERLIYILPFYPDRVVHHAIMNILEPILDGLMYEHSYACRKNKGQHAGSKYCMGLVKKNKYCLQCDISKFYPSIDHAILKEIIRHKIKDKQLLVLLDEIIDSIPGEKNTPIGNYLSQWFGNLYMNELDTYVKQELKVKDYMRYCDDFVLFSNDKTELKEWADKIENFVHEKLDLKLSKKRVYPTSQGVDFLGYRHFPDYILVRKRTAKRIKKHMKELVYLWRSGRITQEKALSKIASAKGWLKHAQTYNLKLAMKIDEIELEIRANQRGKNNK